MCVLPANIIVFLDGIPQKELEDYLIKRKSHRQPTEDV
jgi:hypothetical protein